MVWSTFSSSLLIADTPPIRTMWAIKFTTNVEASASMTLNDMHFYFDTIPSLTPHYVFTSSCVFLLILFFSTVVLALIFIYLPLSVLPVSPSLWWQCPAVMRQGQRSEIHLNTDATLWRPIPSHCSAPPCMLHPNWWMDCSCENIYYLSCINHWVSYPFTGTMCFLNVLKKFMEENNLFFIVQDRGVAAVAVCVCVCVKRLPGKPLRICWSQVHLHLKCFHPALWLTKGPAISIF